MVERDVEVDNVSLLQWPQVWDAVADDLVHRDAAGFREVAVIQWRGIAVPVNRSLVHNGVCGCGMRQLGVETVWRLKAQDPHPARRL